jgi:hypothetical protein
MKRLVTLILVALRLTSSAQSNNTDYTLTVKFEPSFLNPSKLIIHSGKDSNWAQLEIYKHYKDVNPVSANKVQLEAKTLNQLTDFLSTYQFRITNSIIDSIVRYRKTANGDSVKEVFMEMGSDGITVRGALDQYNTIKKFEFWSPNKGTANEKLVQILFRILYNAYNDEIFINYFESLEQYFPHRLGLKKISDTPLKYKLYGDIYIEYEQQLENFFDSLPHNEKVFIDMSNFEGMDGFSESIIEDYVSKNKKIYWINPTDPALLHLYDAGVRNSHIISKRKIIRIEEKDGKRKIIYKNF